MPPSRHRRRRADRRSSRRTPPIATGGGFRSRWLLIAFAVIAGLFILALLAPVVLPLNFGGTGRGSADGYVQGVGMEVETSEDRAHFATNFVIADVTGGDGYSTTPPTSGRHWDGWVACGFYAPDQPVPDERIVHNMEHGNIVVSYNLTDPDQLQELEDAFDSIGKTNLWGVARFYDQIPEGTVALTTWGVIDGPMEGVQKDRIEAFFDAYSGTLSPEFPNGGAPCTQGGVMNPA